MAEDNDHLRAQLDELLGQYDSVRKSLSDVHTKMHEVSGHAESADRLIGVTVGSRGTLSELRLDARVYRKLAPSQLAESIVEVVRRANADATTQVGALLAPVLPAGVPVDDLVGGEIDPTSWTRGNPLTDVSMREWWQSAVTFRRS